MSGADLLRRAADKLRDPLYLDRDAREALADWLGHAAEDFNGDEAHTNFAVDFAHAVLREDGES